MKLSGWGRYPVIDAQLSCPRDEDDLRAAVLAGPVIARGNGRAYGDSAINAGATLQTRHLNRMIAFDEATGVLVAEAGVLLGDIIAAFLPRGWFPLVIPGTKYVTLGGAIAADVHGKNHHRDGSFRSCVDWVEVMTGEGRVIRCGPDDDPALFDHTLGGMGLTGVILRAAIRLRPVRSGWIRQTTRPAANLDAAIEAFEAAGEATYSVAWIDCLATGAALGRSLIMLGEHATPEDLPPAHRTAPFDIRTRRRLAVPLDLPAFALNRLSVRAFNALYYRAGLKGGTDQIVDWDRYFFPLDAILGWNRIYGRKGFAQFQCVLPLATSRDGLQALLSATSAAGCGSFLAVLKRFGAQDSAFSFPMEGYTLALDFPVTDRTLALMEEMDRITMDHGGRLYLAKDSRMTAQTLTQTDTRATAFRDRRKAEGWRDAFQSAQSDRLEL